MDNVMAFANGLRAAGIISARTVGVLLNQEIGSMEALRSALLSGEPERWRGAGRKTIVELQKAAMLPEGSWAKQVFCPHCRLPIDVTVTISDPGGCPKIC